TIEEEKDIFEIEQILNHRMMTSKSGKKEYEYFVKWKGYSDEYNSWIPYENFIDTAILEAYCKRRRLADSNSFDNEQPKSTSRRSTKKRHSRDDRSSSVAMKRAKLQ